MLNPTYSRLLHCGLIVWIAIATEASAAEPRWLLPPDPIGAKKLEETGQYITQFTIPETGMHSYDGRALHIPCLVMIPTWDEDGPNYATMIKVVFNATSTHYPRRKVCLSVYDGRRPVESSLNTGESWIFRGKNYRVFDFYLADGDVIPVLGQLYAIKLLTSRKAVQLTRVTDSIPQEFRPNSEQPSRTIALTSVEPWLYCVAGSKYSRAPRVFDEVRLVRIDEATRRAAIHLIPDASTISTSIHRKPVGGEIKQGDVLAPSGRPHAYRVLNVVPPQTIDGIGRLVGWIELGAEPVTPTGDDNVATLRVLHNVPYAITANTQPPKPEEDDWGLAPLGYALVIGLPILIPMVFMGMGYWLGRRHTSKSRPSDPAI